MTTPLVAIDDGYAQTKLYGDNPNGGAPIRLSFRTSVRSGRYGLTSMDGGSTDAYRTEEGEVFTVSDSVAGENTQFDSFHISTMNRTLVNHALSKAGYGGHEVNVVAGLPVSDFFLNGETNQGKIAEKTANLHKGIERVGGKTPLATIADVTIGCQAVAAWVDFVLDDQLEYTLREQDLQKRIAIVDIGGRTTDIAVVVGGSQIDHSQSDTANIGVLDVYKALLAGIRTKFDIRDDFPTAVLDRAVRTGKIELWGEDQDVADLVEKAVAEIAGKVQREVERRIGDAASIFKVVFVGGGGALFASLPQSMRNGHLPDDPEFSNARGLWKFARLREKLAAEAA